MLVGQKLGPYTIEKELGSGAMGTVYRARHGETGDRVAVKVMAPFLGSNDKALLRFKRETDIIKQLDHPNIVRLVISGRIGKNPFYAMEYVEGESLDRVLARRGRLSWEEVVRLGMPLCEALHHAHQMSIIHRDLKPSNLMMLRNGTPKLMDFGIAKDLDETALTETNRTVGTAAYMSPEQCRGDKNITSKSDLYSLGVMFYELLTGRKPFQAESAMEMFIKHNKGTFERPSRLCLDIPIWLDTLVCQMLEKTPDKRPYDAMAVHQALSRIKEKVDAQQSAGIERAKARRMDRTDLLPTLDEGDKEAARTLLHKKKRRTPFYRKGWFLAAGLLGLACVAGYLFYWAFIKPPSAESLLAEIQRLRQSADIQERESVLKEAIPDFLRYYPDHSEANRVRQWRDDIQCAQCERQMYNRRRNKWKEEEGEKLARMALNDEDLGRLPEALKHWKELTAYKNKPAEDPERPWGLVAERFIAMHAASTKRHDELKDTAAQFAQKKTKAPDWGSERPLAERLVLDALFADLSNRKAGLELWEKAARTIDAESPDRVYYLMATKQMHALRKQ